MQHDISKTDARQGVTPHMTRYVLSYGLILVILSLIVVYAFIF